MKIRVGDIVIVGQMKTGDSYPAVVKNVHSNTVIDVFVFGGEQREMEKVDHYLTVANGDNWTWSERDPE